MIDNLKLGKQLIAFFTHVNAEFKSTRLKKISKVEKDGGLFPDIDAAVQEFEALVSWSQFGGGPEQKVPEPVKGFDPAYDKAKERMNEVQSELEKYLKEMRIKLGYKRCYDIKYVHSKMPYEIEVPEKCLEETGK